jgi:molecular chaperone HtpG
MNKHTTETRSFDAEIGKMLHLMIHSLYTNKDIFLRELISNASDACDKLRFLAVSDVSLLGTDTELAITISTNKHQRTISITDNGIGMNKEDLIEHLGTIARSGTQQFLQSVSGDNNKDVQLIGQFGVGFYACFMVADMVTVTSQKAGESQAWQWTSEGKGEFTISPYDKSDDFQGRGTRITLHLRQEEEIYTDQFRIQHIIRTYSDHIGLPISLIQEDGKSEIINSASALWTKSKSDISEEQYQNFYHHVAHSPDEPWMVLHNKNEGLIEYTNLLFIPTKKPFDLFHPDRRSRVKLYVKRVFITDEGVELIPAWLRFLRGVVDSEDLPLNISRETLQHNDVIAKIRKSLVKRVLIELKKKAEHDANSYLNFWEEFGSVVKEGLCEPGEEKNALLEVCRFHSSSGDNLTSLDEYISRMKEKQDTIFYVTGDQVDSLRNNPKLEGFTKRGIEVLFFTDTVDDFWVNVVHEYKDNKIQSITRSGIELDTIVPLADEANDTEDQENNSGDIESQTDEMNQLCQWIKEQLGEKVALVSLSKKLSDSPVCLSVPEGAMDMRMERFLIDQKQLHVRSAKNMEINAKHPIIRKLAHDLKKQQMDGLSEVVTILFDQACIIEGEPISDPGAFSKRLNQFLIRALAA